MATFGVSIKKDYGFITLEGPDENDILSNLQKLQSLESKVDEALGFDIRMPPEIADKIDDFGYIERILILLNYAPKPLSKPECKMRTRVLNMPEGWWNGSNFTRDIGRLPPGLVAVSNENGVTRYSLTDQGKEHVKSFIKNKSS
jgi:hypothetical protein